MPSRIDAGPRWDEQHIVQRNLWTEPVAQHFSSSWKSVPVAAMQCDHLAQALNELGIGSFRPIEETLVDMARSLIAAGQVTPKFNSNHVTAANGGH